MIKFIFFLLGILAVCFISEIRASLVMAANQITRIEVNVREGKLSANVENAPLVDILLRIGEEAGFRLVLLGGLESPTTQAFSNVSLPEGIRRLARNHSVAIMYQIVDSPDDRKKLQNVKEVWVIDTEGPEGIIEADSSESSIQNDQPDSTPSIRKKVASTQPEFEEDTDVGYWADILYNTNDRSIREQAITELQRIGSDAAIVAMATVLGNDDVQLRRHTVESLANVDNASAVQVLGQVLIGDKDPSVRNRVVRFFSGQRNEVSRAFLKAALEDKDQHVRELAKQALAVY